MDEKTRNEIAESALKGTPGRGGINTELTILVGDAPKQYNLNGVTIPGTIDAPLRWLRTRESLIDFSKCHIIANREQMTITLVCKENQHDKDTITGALIISPEMKLFGINADNGRLTNFDMSRLFKMNRSFFETKTKAMELVTILQNFKAKVDTDLEKADDRRGNTKLLRNQIVQSNLPEEFVLEIPIFKGEPKQRILVEVDIDPDDFSCSLISADAADIIHETVDLRFNGILGDIEEHFPAVAIIEQ